MITCETPDEKLQAALEKLHENQWALLEDWLESSEVQHLKDLAVQKWKSGSFEPAKVGRSLERQTAREIRSDWTSWVDLQDPAFSDFAQKINSLQTALNRTLYCGIHHFECHFARYDQGQFYDEHIDQPRLKSQLHGDRVISFVLYLNENWETSMGGQLSLRNTSEEIQINPVWGRIVLFRSDTVPHAVLAANSERWSLTGWFRRS